VICMSDRLVKEARRMAVEDGMSLVEISKFTNISTLKLGRMASAENWKHEREVFLSLKYKSGADSPKAEAQAQELGEVYDRLIGLIKCTLSDIEAGKAVMDSKMIVALSGLLMKVDALETSRVALASMTAKKSTKEIEDLSPEAFGKALSAFMEKAN